MDVKKKWGQEWTQIFNHENFVLNELKQSIDLYIYKHPVRAICSSENTRISDLYILTKFDCEMYYTTGFNWQYQTHSLKEIWNNSFSKIVIDMVFLAANYLGSFTTSLGNKEITSIRFFNTRIKHLSLIQMSADTVHTFALKYFAPRRYYFSAKHISGMSKEFLIRRKNMFVLKKKKACFWIFDIDYWKFELILVALVSLFEDLNIKNN